MKFFSNLLWLLLKVSEVNTKKKKKIKKHITKGFVWQKKKKCPKQELEVSPCSGLYLLVLTQRK